MKLVVYKQLYWIVSLWRYQASNCNVTLEIFCFTIYGMCWLKFNIVVLVLVYSRAIEKDCITLITVLCVNRIICVTGSTVINHASSNHTKLYCICVNCWRVPIKFYILALSLVVYYFNWGYQCFSTIHVFLFSMNSLSIML